PVLGRPRRPVGARGALAGSGGRPGARPSRATSPCGPRRHARASQELNTGPTDLKTTRLAADTRDHMVDARLRLGPRHPVDVQRDGDIVPGVAQPVDTLQPRRRRDRIAGPAQRFSHGPCQLTVRVPPVMGLAELALQYPVGAPGLVAMHRSRLPGTPDQVENGETAMR